MTRKVLIIGGYGYIGSALFRHLSTRENLSLSVVDTSIRGNPARIDGQEIDYLQLEPRYIRAFDDIVLLAGHSSVGACVHDEAGALRNNVVGLHRLLDHLVEGRLIYASSGSVYDGCADVPATESAQLSISRNIYDFTKIAGDELARLSGKRCIGLRFGTVSGLSPNTRMELLVNKMTSDALTTGIISLANPTSHRAILGVGDLVKAISAILDRPTASTGCYNLCSENVTMLNVAMRISKLTAARIEHLQDSPTYDFSMSNERASTLLNWTPKETVETIAGTISAAYSP